MKLKEKYNNDLLNYIRKLALSKQLNILIGSGCSVPAIPLMREYTKYGEDANRYLIDRVKKVSQLLISFPHANNRAAKTVIGKKTIATLKIYENFMSNIVNILEMSNSRQVPRSVNIFTTNYDLFIEKSVNNLHHHKRIVFNDGANGYFQRIIDSSNYNRVVSYKGLNDNYISEIPSINLIKSHGSSNWMAEKGKVIVYPSVVQNPMIVPPTGIEGEETFLNNYFHDMLRTFQVELDKPQAVLFVIGFSFQDDHIAKMVRRALQNPELIVLLFTYSNNIETYLKNLGYTHIPCNLKVFSPSDIFSEEYVSKLKNDDGKDAVLVLENLADIVGTDFDDKNYEKNE